MRYLFAHRGAFIRSIQVIAGPLHDAAKAGDVGLAKQLLDQGAAVAAPDAAGEPPLLIASLAGHADVVALLLERGSESRSATRAG